MVQKIKEAYSNILESIGEDVNREGLIKTPDRAAKAMLFFTRGYNENLKTIVNGAIFESDKNNNMIIVNNYECYPRYLWKLQDDLHLFI